MLENLGHNFLEVAAVAADEDGIRGCDRIAANGTEIADVDVDAWSAEAAGVFVDDGFALRANFEGFDIQVRELQTGFYRNAARTKADVP